MIYKIYKITKPSDNGVYIGITTKSLTDRLKDHLIDLYHAKIKELRNYDPKCKITRPLLLWLDETCTIQLIENTDDSLREKFWILDYRNNNNYNSKNARNFKS